MARTKTSGPTEKELYILSIIWKNGSSTVRQVNKIMNRSENTGYTTTLKQMQIMFEKGLLKRDDSAKTHIYSPANSEKIIQEKIMSNLVDKVFAGSTEKLVMRALSSKKVSADELLRIKSLIAQKENEF